METDAQIPAEAEAWMASEQGVICGKLADVIAYAPENTEIFLRLPDVENAGWVRSKTENTSVGLCSSDLSMMWSDSLSNVSDFSEKCK